MDKEYSTQATDPSMENGASLGNRLSVSPRVLSDEEKEQINQLEQQMISHIKQANLCVLIAEAIQNGDMMTYMKLTHQRGW